MKHILIFSAVCAAALMSGCGKNNSESVIPSDENATQAPVISNPNTVIPNPVQCKENYQGTAAIRMDMTGILKPEDTNGETKWLRLYGTGDPAENIWLTIDGKPKGFIVYNNSDGGQEGIKVDLVFLVDNSGSMSEEADSIAAGIIDWTAKLEKEGKIDIRFACVGYDGRITGAKDLCPVDSLHSFLNYSTGTARTAHFAEQRLKTAASRYGGVYCDECGAMALLFGDENISFRESANRIYVNFTDEPNMPHGNAKYSTEYYKDTENWNPAKGTVHTVFSADTTGFHESIGYSEKPWRLSWYTGGTILITDSHFRGVSLSSLPITGALMNSYILRYSNYESLFDGNEHTVEITVKSTDDAVRAYKTYKVNYSISVK